MMRYGHFHALACMWLCLGHLLCYTTSYATVRQFAYEHMQIDHSHQGHGSIMAAADSVTWQEHNHCHFSAMQ